MPILFDDGNHHIDFLPFTYTRPISELRIGILRICEKWQYHLNDHDIAYKSRPILAAKYPSRTKNPSGLIIYGGLLPDHNIVQQIKSLKDGEKLLDTEGNFLAARVNTYEDYDIEKLNSVSSSFEIRKLDSLWQLFKWNGEEIKKDIDLVQPHSHQISDTNTVIGSNPIIACENSRIEACILNVEEGPIYIGKNAHVMEGSILKGPLAICDDSTIKMGAKLYSNSTIGPNCKVGGEVNNSIYYAYSNKGHDGFLGNSIIGEWCNIGADSNNSNLKNNYANVKLWNYGKESFIDTGEQFCGLMMGDHSKCGINTMFNTGTVTGVSCNIFGSGFPRNFIPSFSWGGSNGFKTYNFNKSLESAKLMMERRGKSLSDADIEILKDSFEQDQKFRND